MHDIDVQLNHMLHGEFESAWNISQKLENLGLEKILDPSGNKNPEMWLRHKFNRAWFALREYDFQTGSKLLESGRHIGVYGGGLLKTNAPIFNPSQHDIKDKTIIISLEGGFGDEVIHVRFASSYKRLGAKKVIVACSPELKSIFERVRDVDQVILRNESNTVQHDYWIPGFSAGWVAGHSYEDLPNEPYLIANDTSLHIWSGIINSEKKKIGIRWAGNPKFEHQQFRKFPVEFMFELAKYDDIQLYSLQRDNNLEDLPANVIDLEKWLIGWEDTLAAISHMDLIITSCTSIAHIAAALGKETWVLPPILPYHTWAPGAPESKTSPWYPSVTLFRQKEYQKWNSTFENLYSALEQKYNLSKVQHKNHDRIPKKLNMGSGSHKIKGFINVDKSSYVNPDMVFDFEKTSWPWQDDEFDHIIAKDILEHLGQSTASFLNIIKEMYRISRNGAIWEIQTPHWRSDNLLNDPTHIRAITPEMIQLFNQKNIMWTVQEKMGHSALAFDLNIDLELCDTQFEYTHIFKDKIKNKQFTSEELNLMFNTMNNVAESVRMLVQVHKPGRFTIEEYIEAIEKVQSE